MNFLASQWGFFLALSVSQWLSCSKRTCWTVQKTLQPTLHVNSLVFFWPCLCSGEFRLGLEGLLAMSMVRLQGWETHQIQACNPQLWPSVPVSFPHSARVCGKVHPNSAPGWFRMDIRQSTQAYGVTAHPTANRKGINNLDLRNQEKGVLAKGVSVESCVTAKEAKNTQGY